MRGQILLDGRGTRWVFVPEEHIRFCPCVDGQWGLVIAFGTNAQCYYNEGAIHIERWLELSHCFTSKLQVPSEIVNFAIESERARPKLRQDAEEIFWNLTANFLDGNINTEVLRQRLDMLLPGRTDKELEYAVACQLKELLHNGRGLH